MPFRSHSSSGSPSLLISTSPPNFKKRTPSRQPLLWAALSFACGLWAGKYLWRPPSWWVIAALVCAASAAYLLKRRVLAPRALALAAVFLVGVLTIQVRGAGDSGQVWLGDGEPVFVTAHVIVEGNVQADGPAELHQRIDMETEKIESAGASPMQSRNVHAGVRLNIYSRMEEDDSSQRQPAPCSSFTTASASGFPRLWLRRAITAIREHSTTPHICGTKESLQPPRRNMSPSKCSPDFPAAASCSRWRGSIAAFLEKSTLCGQSVWRD